MCAVCDLSESVFQTASSLSDELIDSDRRGVTLIYRLLLIQLIHFEMEITLFGCKQKGIRGQI